jgi:LacI family transcriptional regulator
MPAPVGCSLDAYCLSSSKGRFAPSRKTRVVLTTFSEIIIVQTANQLRHPSTDPPSSICHSSRNHKDTIMPEPATVIDVAKAAGVSISTVLRILNGTAQVAPDKRHRVLEAVKILGYRPNVHAQSRVQGRSQTIGVITPDMSSAFYAAAMAGVEYNLSSSGFYPLFASAHWQADTEAMAINLLLSRGIDGLVVMGGLSPDAFLNSLAERLPVAVMGRIVPGLEGQCVAIDNLHGAFLATKHLLELGHQRIAHISGPRNNPDVQARLHGYRKALEQSGIAFNPQLVVEGDLLETSGMVALESLLSKGNNFSAVFAANDQMAVGARLGLARRNLRVPDDVSLIGFDDLPGTAFTNPPLTTIRQPVALMGRTVAHYVVATLNKQEYDLEPVKLELIVRESTRPLGLEFEQDLLVHRR